MPSCILKSDSITLFHDHETKDLYNHWRQPGYSQVIYYDKKKLK